MTGQVPRAVPAESLPLDALTGLDGTQEPAPQPPFSDPLAGLVTGELLPRPVSLSSTALDPSPRAAPELAALDPEAVRRTARELAAEPAGRRGPRQPTRNRTVAQPRKRPSSAAPRQPRAYPQAPAGGDRRTVAQGSGAPRRRFSVGGCLIALLVFGVIGFNVLRALLENLSHLFH